MPDDTPRDLFGVRTGAATEDYRAKPRQLYATDLATMRIPKMYWRTTLDESPESTRAEIGTILDRIGNGQIYDPEGITLLLVGSEGVGKTGAATLVAKRARAWRHSVLFTTWRQIRDARRNPDAAMYDVESQKTLWARAVEVRLLVLDDITPDDVDDRYHGHDVLLALLRDRAQAQQSTVLTTRASLDTTLPDYADRFPGSVLATIPRVLALRVTGPNLTLRRNQALGESLYR